MMHYLEMRCHGNGSGNTIQTESKRYKTPKLLHVVTWLRGMIKTLSARYTSSHYTDIHTRYVDTDNILKITDRVTRGFTQIK
jgi:hypothetical protein